MMLLSRVTRVKLSLSMVPGMTPPVVVIKIPLTPEKGRAPGAVAAPSISEFVIERSQSVPGCVLPTKPLAPLKFTLSKYV